ncbi:FAD-dependent oxidoreductase [Mycobacterium sp. NPDC050441]|uniref:FAD-dependent oxidoreductase n=1 Tax=Mycobacterium sp. NPDC050441 TaxID=3155403 RepID=UPI0034027361
MFRQKPAVPNTVNGQVSHWFDELPTPRPALPGDRDADVCIVGAGYTGLWTAYYLAQADPSLRITVLEAADGARTSPIARVADVITRKPH